MSPSAVQEETFVGRGDLTLFGRSWRPDGPVRGVVVIMHGFLSHSGQYLWSAERFNEKGLAVYAFDMRGHGQSEGERYWVDAFDDYLDDLDRFIAIVRSREPGKPLVLLGHSAGGVIATAYALKHPEGLLGLVCESFAFEVPPPELVLQLLKGVSHVLPHAPVLRLKPEDFSRDPAVVDAIERDPLVIHEPGPAHTVAELVRAHDLLGRSFGSFSLPVLILHGTEDHATRPQGSQRFFDEAGSADKTLRFYDGHFHDLLADLGREEVMADIQAWIDDRLPAA